MAISIGLLARTLLGKRLFPLVGRIYRSMFVDLDKVSTLISKEIPVNALVLDVGGGDGELLNKLLMIRSDIRAILIDPSDDIGAAIARPHRHRVRFLPKTGLRKFITTFETRINCIVVCDVVHHIASTERISFFRDLKTIFDNNESVILIKDIEPGFFVSFMSYLSDRFITGDRNVELISEAELRSLAEPILGNIKFCNTTLFNENKPNYLLSIRHN